MRLFDTHCHLAGKDMMNEAEAYVQKGLAANVEGFAIIAADAESLRAARTLSQKLSAAHPQLKILSTAGIHPHDAQGVTDSLWQEVVDCARDARAIGETGLDYHYNHSSPEVQKEIFARHISLACETSKALVIHCREAADDILSMLEASTELKRHPRPGIIHCFSEDDAVARRALALNFYISFSGILTFKNADRLRKVAASIPLERILIETDSPWLAPVPYRGKTNEPAYVAQVFECLTTLRTESRDEIADRLWQNSCDVYGWGAAS